MEVESFSQDNGTDAHVDAPVDGPIVVEGFGLNPSPLGGGVRRRRRGDCDTKKKPRTLRKSKGKKGKKGKKGSGKKGKRGTQRRRRNSQRRRRR